MFHKNTYKEVCKLASLNKRSYGGDMVGDGTSYYDRSNFYSFDPQWDDPDTWLKDKGVYKDVSSGLKAYAEDILKNEITLEGAPVTKVVLSKVPYNESNNIDGKAWAKRALKAVKQKNEKEITNLASYGFAYYGTDKATDVPVTKNRSKNTSFPWSTFLTLMAIVAAGPAFVYTLKKLT